MTGTTENQLTALVRVGAAGPPGGPRGRRERGLRRARPCWLALTRYVLRFPASVALAREEIVDRGSEPRCSGYLTASRP